MRFDFHDSAGESDVVFFKSLSENSKGGCFRAKGWLARRDEGEYPSWVFD
jgi:hypothetical protein